MKKYFGVFLFLLFSIAVFSQNKTKDYYLQKSKTQKTVGTVLVLTGSALIVTGIIVDAAKNDQYTEDYTGGYILLGGRQRCNYQHSFFCCLKKK